MGILDFIKNNLDKILIGIGLLAVVFFPKIKAALSEAAGGTEAPLLANSQAKIAAAAMSQSNRSTARATSLSGLLPQCRLGRTAWIAS